MIQHVTREIFPSELDRSAVFYGLLGFERVPAPPGIEGRAVWLERAGTQIHLMFVDESLTTSRGLSGHVGIVVPAYRETIERLEAAGHHVEARREHWGSPRGYVRDPAGYLVEVMAWAPGQEPRHEPRGHKPRGHEPPFRAAQGE